MFEPAPPIDRPYRFEIKEHKDTVEAIASALSDLRIDGVTRIGDKTYVIFPNRIPLSLAREVVRRLR